MYPFDTETIELLRQPLDASVIKHRRGGGGKMLKYVKGDYVIDTANRIWGFGAWGYKVISRGHEIIEDGKKGKMEYYTADIELHVQGAAFPFPGDGVGVVTEPFTVEMHEKARKEATTDALKRALRHYGDQFGLSLYSEDDYVLDEGTLVQVKDVHPGGNASQPKRIVEAQRATMLTTQATPNHTPQDERTGVGANKREREASGEQVNGKNGQPTSSPLNTIYLSAIKRKFFTTTRGNEQADFLKWVGCLFPDRQVSNPADISQEMIEYLEAQVSQEAAHA